MRYNGTLHQMGENIKLKKIGLQSFIRINLYSANFIKFMSVNNIEIGNDNLAEGNKICYWEYVKYWITLGIMIRETNRENN